jgi:carboxypeptidase T
MASFHMNDVGGTFTVDPPGPLPPVTVTLASLKDDLDALRAAAPAGIVDGAVTSIGHSEQGKELHAIRIGKDPSFPVLIAGCHHAREWISVEVPFLIADFLVKNYTSDPQVKRIVDTRDIWIVPLVNPDGHEHTVTTDRGWRKTFPTDVTRESVDPNRNYETSRWATAEGAFEDDPASHTYRGPRPGYTAEVRAMQDLIRARQFRATLDFHSFGRWILFPWAGRPEPHPDSLHEELAHDLARVIDGKGATYTRLAGGQLYAQPPWLKSPTQAVVAGGMLDFVAETLPNAFAITVELEPAQGDPRGFYIGEADIQPAFDLVRGAILTFLNRVGTMRDRPGTRRLVLHAGADNQLALVRSEPWRAFASY